MVIGCQKTMAKFVPDTWQLTDKLRQYASLKGLTAATIDDQEEAFRLCQFNRDIKCWDRAWMRWIRSAIEWGKVVPVMKTEYRRPEELSPAQKRIDADKAEADFKRLRAVK